MSLKNHNFNPHNATQHPMRENIVEPEFWAVEYHEGWHPDLPEGIIAYAPETSFIDRWTLPEFTPGEPEVDDYAFKVYVRQAMRAALRGTLRDDFEGGVVDVMAEVWPKLHMLVPEGQGPHPDDEHSFRIGLQINDEEISWISPVPFDRYSTVVWGDVEVQPDDEVRIYLLGKWKIDNTVFVNAVWFEDPSDPPAPPPPSGSLTVELGPLTRQTIADGLNAIAEALGLSFSPGVPTPPEEPAIVDLRGQLATNPNSPWYPWRTRTLEEITHVFVHHSAGVQTSDVGYVHNIALYHTGATGKNRPGICYAFVIGADGTIWQTSDLEDVVFGQGSVDHPGDENRWGVAVCLLGSFIDGREPSAAQIAALEHLIGYLEDVVQRPLQVWGHKDVIGTQCPGDSWPFKPEWGKEPVVPPPPPAGPTRNVRGAHGAPILTPPEDIEGLVARLQALGIGWYKLLDNGNPRNLDLIRALRVAGIEPVVRLYQDRQFPECLSSRLRDRMPALAAAGATYVEIGNEPNLRNEWDGVDPTWQSTDLVDLLADVWWADAQVALAAGLKPAIYAMAPTERDRGTHPRYSSVKWLSGMLERLKAKHGQALRGLLNAGDVWLAVHTADFGRDFDYDPWAGGIDDMCLRGYEVARKMVRDLFHVEPLVISTEGGVYAPGHLQDLSWPTTYSEGEWGARVAAMYDYVRRQTSLTAICSWTFSDEGVQDERWLGCGWYDRHGQPRSPVAALRQ